MPYIQLTFSASSSPFNPLRYNLLSPIFCCAVEYMYFRSNTVQLNHQISVVRNTPFSFSSLGLFTRPNDFQALLFSARMAETSKDLIESCEKQIFLSREVQINGYDDEFRESFFNEDDKEFQRRKKIGLANKGKVPWNKGKEHSAETRERIKQRTLEALRDPKVRKKMSEHPRAQSDQIKDKISSSLRRIWGKRLKWKRSREKFFVSWAESIAIAARRGGKEQEELDWDSYDKIKQQMLVQQLQWATEMAKAKEKMQRVSCKRKEQKRKVKKKEVIKGAVRRKSKKDTTEVTVAEILKLKQRLTKIRKKKSTNGVITSQSHGNKNSHITTWEKLDLELIKKGKMQKEVSLADQIRFAKNRKAEQPKTSKGLVTSISSYSSNERSED